MSRTIIIHPQLSIPLSELGFQFTRSGGPGGQNVNKVSTRVELVFDVQGSASLTSDQKARIAQVLKSRLDSGGVLHIAAQESRSQWRNREDVVERFAALLAHALKPQKKRVATRATSGSRQKRLKSKKAHGLKKQTRGRVSLD